MERSPLAEKIYEASEAFGRVSRDEEWNTLDSLYLWGYYRGIEGFTSMDDYNAMDTPFEGIEIYNQGFEDGKGDREVLQR